MSLGKTQIAKIVYVGQGGPLSLIPFKRLCEKGLSPQVVIVPQWNAGSKGLNLLPVQVPHPEGSLAHAAAALGIPVMSWQMGREAEITANLATISPDLVIMSCFPWRITEQLLEVPALGWWNLHPSLLPQYRGPVPLFWQARAGESQTGISLHQVESCLDSGPILGQQSVSMQECLLGDLEKTLAEQGASLIEQALVALVEGTLQPESQKEVEASYQGFPSYQDRCIQIKGSAVAAYRFIRLVNSTYPLWFDIDGSQYKVREVIGVDEAKRLLSPGIFVKGELQVQFEQGVLTVACDKND